MKLSIQLKNQIKKIDYYKESLKKWKLFLGFYKQ